MKKLVLMMVFGLGFSLVAQAQSRDRMRGADVSPEERTKQQIQKMRDALALTDQQILDLEPILLQHHKEMFLKREEMRAHHKAMKKDMEALKAELKQVLSEEQVEKMEALRGEHRKRMREHHRRMEESKED